MAANEYYTGSPTFPPPQQAMNSPAPPPYSPIPQAQASPRPSPRPQSFDQKQTVRDPSPYRLPSRQPAYPAPQNNGAWGQNPQGYRPSQHYNQPYGPPPAGSPMPQQVRFAPSPALLPRRRAYSEAYWQRQPYSSQQQQGYVPQQAPYPPQPQNLHPQMNTHLPGGDPYQRPYESDSDYDRSSDRPHRRHHHRQSQSHSPRRRRKSSSHASRDTFLGAGAGGIIGDVLIGPGVGTLGGALIGALSGKKHGDKKARSEERRKRSVSRDSRY